ncbi:RNA 3'-terminal phosphate cyclase-like protein [Dictyocoela muelleri]|nr:RNA 3'-terminal phosphate cyclase-like protein [Dictyocoela muelleri]
MLEFEDSNLNIFSYSLLSRKNIKYKIDNKQKLINFLNLVKLISPDSKYEFFGNFVEFYPGQLVGGNIEFSSDLNFLIPILLLSPFMKKGISLKLKCQTNGLIENFEEKVSSRTNKIIENSNQTSLISADVIRLVYLPALRKFGVNCQLDIVKRDFGPDGEIFFSCMKKDLLKKVILQNQKISKIRGIAISSRLNSIPVNTMVKIVREELQPLVKNTKIFTDMWNRINSGQHPGCELVLFAENKFNVFYSISSYFRENKDKKDLSRENSIENSCIEKCCIDSSREDCINNKEFINNNCIKNNNCINNNDCMNSNDCINNKDIIDSNSDDCINSNDSECKDNNNSNGESSYKKPLMNKNLENSTLKCIIDLMESIKKSGSFDHKIVDFILPLIALCNGVSKIQIINCEENHRRTLELLEIFFNLTYKIEDNDWFIGYGIGFKG